MQRAPAPSLADFRCIHSSTQHGRSIACYRSASTEVLAEYKVSYSKKYAAQSALYIEEAKRCSGSNGDASRIIDTTFPPVLMSIAEHQFGFDVQYGKTKPGSALVSHGFARTSPKVSTRGLEAIEYVVFSDGMADAPKARADHGNWRLIVDTSAKIGEPLVKALRQQGIDAFLAVVDIDMKRAPLAPPRPKEPSLPQALTKAVASNFKSEGFEEMSDRDLKRYTGKTRQQMLDTILTGMAFGAPKMISGPEIRILMKDSGLSCTQSGQGAIGAYLLAFEGQKDVQVDFGSVSAMVLGMGTCATRSNAKQYVRNLVDDAKQSVLLGLQ